MTKIAHQTGMCIKYIQIMMQHQDSEFKNQIQGSKKKAKLHSLPNLKEVIKRSKCNTMSEVMDMDRTIFLGVTLKWHIEYMNVILLVTSYLGFRRRSHLQPIPCP